jgi:hypothetical protein
MQDHNPTTLSLDEAKELLGRADRYEEASASGDCEVYWLGQPPDAVDKDLIAVGYFSDPQLTSVCITLPNGKSVSFTGLEAWALFGCGNGRGAVGENSSTPGTHRPI